MDSSPRVTIRDIANSLGLSRAAISLGLRNSPQIAKATRDKIQATAAAMGYQPNLSAANLAQFRHASNGRTVHAAIAWINSWKVPTDMRAYRQFDLYWSNARETAEAAGFRVEEFTIEQGTNVARLQNILLTRNIRGIIIPPQQRSGHWSKMSGGDFDWNRFSAVRIGHSVRQPMVSVVGPDQVANAMLAVEEMTARGYNRIGYISFKEVRKTSQNWFLGGFYLAQMALPPSHHLPVFYLDGQKEDHDSGRLASWIEKHKPDAILTEWSEVVPSLEALGIRVPEEIGLAVLNTIDCGLDAGIYQNPEHIGKAAAEVLIALINRNERGESSDYRTTTVMGRWQDGPTLPDKTGKATERKTAGA